MLIRTLFIVAAFLTASVANASQRIFGECNNCSNTQMRNMATNLAPPFSVDRMVYIYDFSTERITKYLVDKETEPGSSFIYVREAQIESAISIDFETAIIALQSLTIPMNNPIDVTDYPTAFDVVNNSNAQRALVELARDVEGWRWEPLWWGSAAINVTNRLTGVTVTIRYNFPDGSTVLFRLTDFDPEDLSFSLQFVNAQDGHGNSIHQTAMGFVGDTGTTGPTGSSSRDAFIGFLNGIGVFVSENGSSGGGGGNATECVVAPNGDYVCTLRD